MSDHTRRGPQRHSAVRRVAIWSVALCASVTLCAASDVGAGGGSVRYSPPVAAPVIDPYRPPSTPYGSGNRGLEYAVAPGTPVAAIGPGRVVFAGQVGGRLVVSIDHPDGLRSSLVGLAVVSVDVGDRVARGQVVGRSGVLLHLGVRRNGSYLDPATLFGSTGPARLVPLRRVPMLVAGF